MARRAAAREEVENEIRFIRLGCELQHSPDQLDGLHRVQDIVGLLEDDMVEQFFLCVLGVSYFRIRP